MQNLNKNHVTGMAKPSEYIINQNFKWHVLYTRLYHEKAMETDMLQKHIEVFLPKRRICRTWSDRKKWIEEPLFRSYVFVRISNREYYQVLQHPSVLYFVSFNRMPAIIPSDQIDMIKKIIDNNIDCTVTSNCIAPSRMVEVIDGPLTGFRGEVIKCEGKKHLLVRIGHVYQSLIIQIQPEMLRLA